MAPIVGKPMVVRVMDSLAACGIDDFILVASPDDSELVDYFRSPAGKRGTVQLAFQSERLGTAHALAQAAPLVSGRFVLSACDNLLPEGELGQMLDLWQASPSLMALLALLPVEPERLGSGATVALDGSRITRIIEKPRPEQVASDMASLPLYCFSDRILDYLPRVSLSPRGEYEHQEAIQMLIDDGACVRGYAFRKRLTLTTAADLLAISRHYLARQAARPERRPHAMGPGTRLIEPVCIEPNSLIGAACTIGPDAYLEGGCQIGDGVTIRRAVVLRGSVVPDGSLIQGAVVT
jgi:NDP-sugar pyrophosphorylase family protein